MKSIMTFLLDRDTENVMGVLLKKEPRLKTDMELIVTIESNKIWQDRIKNYNQDCKHKSKNTEIMLPKIGDCIGEIAENLSRISWRNYFSLYILKNKQFLLDNGTETIEYLWLKHDMEKIISKMSYKEFSEKISIIDN